MSGEPYAAVRRILSEAHDQAATGKGRRCHAGFADEPLAFEDQPMQTLAQAMNSQCRRAGLGGLVFQAMKKANESLGKDGKRAKAELLGAIIYLAGAVLLLEQDRAESSRDESDGP